jgi:drug/metabolite transporter (DMT)-like permease
VNAVTHHPRRWLGWAIAICSSLCFSIAYPVARAALTAGVGATEMLVGRMGLAAVLMGITIGVMDWRLLRVDRRCLGLSLLVGMFNGIGMLLYTWGLQRLTSSMTAMLLALTPIYVLTFLALRGERVTYRHLLRLILSLIGVYLLIGPGGHADPIGVILVLLSIIFFSLQTTTIQWFLTGYDARTVSFFMLLAMVVCPVVLWGLEGGVWHPLGQTGWVTVIVLAFFSTFLARLFVFGAISRIGGGQMAMLSPVETLMAVIWSFLFLDERLSPLQWIGGIFILISAVLAIQRLSIARLRPRWRLWGQS